MATIQNQRTLLAKNNTSSLSVTFRKFAFLAVMCFFAVSLHFTFRSPLGQTWIFTAKSNCSQNTTSRPTPSDPPTLARVLYFFLCESQAEIDAYSLIFPSVSADVAFLCWRENCNASKFRPTRNLSVVFWSSSLERDRTLVLSSNDSLAASNDQSFRRIHSRVFIINEKQLQLTQKLTWTTARNKLYELALSEERKQGWRWAFFTFADGDVHIACPLVQQLIVNRSLIANHDDDTVVFASRFWSLVDLDNSTGEVHCFLLFDAFLLSASPAIGTVTGAAGLMAVPGQVSQIVYHIDAMFNAIQRDAAPFVLPYCPRYDSRTWWSSQAIFVYRSLCLYGHVLQLDVVNVARQIHRHYPRRGNAWAIDNDMNLVPQNLQALQGYMQQSRVISPIVLRHYAGWSIALASETCRKHHVAMKLDTCLVHGNRTDR